MAAQPELQRIASIAAAGLLVAAVALCGSAAALVAYGVVHAKPFGPENVYEAGLSINAGLAIDDRTITDVAAGGPAWAAGLRPGWRVDLEPGLMMDGAVGGCGPGSRCTIYHELAVLHDLAGRWIFELAAIGLVGAGAAVWRKRPRLAGLLALTAIAMSAPTYAALGQVPQFPALYAASLLAPPVWLTLTGRHVAWTVALVGALLLAALWVSAWTSAPTSYDAIERTRVLATIAILVGGSAAASGWIARVESPATRDRFVDALAASLAVIWAIVVGSLQIIPEWVVAVVTIIGVVAYFAFRNRIGDLVGRVKLAELGHRATLQALEAERSRVARDLHDVPLQELAAVIHQLDERPGTASEAQRLREIAAYLRDVTVALRPPVLDDVGLGASLKDLVEHRAADGGAPIRISVDDSTGIDPDSRPPADVELAVFRVVQEALANAQGHAESSVIEVRGTISAVHVRVAITDNGRGIDEGAAARAASAGRFGLASMRERATAIGARLRVSAGKDGIGTSVVIEWDRA